MDGQRWKRDRDDQKGQRDLNGSADECRNLHGGSSYGSRKELRGWNQTFSFEIKKHYSV